MEIDAEDKDGDKVFELEDTSTTVKEVQTPVSTANANESSCSKLINLPSLRVSLARAGLKSIIME